MAHKITKLIYSILDVETGQGRRMESKQESQENKNKVKVEERGIETLELENIRTEMLIQEKYESASENSEDRKVNDSDRKINESVVVQNQECGGERNSIIRNNNRESEVVQASSTNTQSKSLDKVVETRRISTRNKKTPSMRGNDIFLW